MATEGDYESGGAGEKFHKMSSVSDFNEEPENVSQEAGQNNSTGELSTHQGGISTSISATTGISEIEQLLKQTTFTRSEIQHLIELLHSRITEESPSDDFQAICLPKRQDSKLNDNNAIFLSKIPMASPKPPVTMENLPDELLLNIFIHLLAKQLAQMRSVSKSWNALLSKSSFIKSHLHHSIHNNDQTLLHFSTLDFELLVYPHLQLTNFIKLPVKPQSRHDSLRLIGSVNGLICSSYTDSIIHIWNPSLSAVITLPPYSMPSDGHEWIKVFFRFGFEPKTDDYKVVKLTGFANLDTDVVIWWMDVEIYSMRKGSWALITERFPSHITWIDEYQVVCADVPNGHLHWLGCTNEKVFSKRIVAFDLGSETFHEIPLPSSILSFKWSQSLGVLDGKLCVMSWGNGDACEVWVMEEYGVVESWVKRHVFSQFIGDTYPFGFTSANKFLIQDDNSHLVLYDPVTEQAQILNNHCSYEECCAGNIVEYTDSLVWVAPARCEMVDGVGQN